MTVTIEKIYCFLNNEIEIAEFENWLYTNPEISSLIGEVNYCALLELNYKNKSIRYSVKEVCESFIEQKYYEFWRTIKLLNQMLSYKTDIVLASQSLRTYCMEQQEKFGESIISGELVTALDSDLDFCPRETKYHLYNKKILKKYLKEANEIFEHYRKDIEIELNRLLEMKNAT